MRDVRRWTDAHIRMGPIGPAERYSGGAYCVPVNSEREVRLLTRAKWVGVLLPIALIWCFELARWWSSTGASRRTTPTSSPPSS